MAEDREKEVNARHSACTFSKWLLVALLVAACGGIVPPPEPKSELKPAVKETTPQSDDPAFPFNNSISVIFNKDMSAQAIRGDTFFLVDDTTGAGVEGVVSVTGPTAKFAPTVDLEKGKTFKATVTAEVEDLFGNTLDAPHIWRFTTSLEPDTTPPTVVSTSPRKDEQNVLTNLTSITVTFSEKIDSTTVTIDDPNPSFDVSGGVKPDTTKGNNGIEVTEENVVFHIDPTDNLDFDKNYTVTLTSGIKDLAGHPLSIDDPLTQNGEWSFHTKPEVDND
ncbi:MAG: Ig-like domain-containing protein [Nitrospiria bacterium]